MSLVPSWTETLIECGVEVVGRTRFCIHPKEVVSSIAVVGGTKDADWGKIGELSPDLIILDKEENPKQFADKSTFPCWASHIRSVEDVAKALVELESLAFSSSQKANLKGLQERCERVLSRGVNKKEFSLIELPVLEWINPPSRNQTNFVYVIWKKPWMVVSKDTYIGSVFTHLGFGSAMIDHEKKYQEIDLLSVYDPETTVLLFSTEPFPFERIKGELKQLPFSSALVDGESYSWFGIRSITFLEKGF